MQISIFKEFCMETKGLDITRLIMSIIAIVWAIVLGVLVGDYFYTINKGDEIANIFLILLFPIIILIGIILIINTIMGILGVKKYFKNKNIALNDRNVGVGRIVVKIIIAILGLSLPLLVAYICDIVEVNKKKKNNS